MKHTLATCAFSANIYLLLGQIEARRLGARYRGVACHSGGETIPGGEGGRHSGERRDGRMAW